MQSGQMEGCLQVMARERCIGRGARWTMLNSGSIQAEGPEEKATVLVGVGPPQEAGPQ